MGKSQSKLKKNHVVNHEENSFVYQPKIIKYHEEYQDIFNTTNLNIIQCIYLVDENDYLTSRVYLCSDEILYLSGKKNKDIGVATSCTFLYIYL